MSSGHASIADIQETHLNTYQSNPDRIGSDAGTERQDRADYDGRFIFELLQNAVDEMADTDDPEVRLELTEESLIVANNGAAFTMDDLYALTLTTRTTKAGDTSIGHKGRGFTSVLGITDRPAVFSESVSARFDRTETAKILSSNLEIREKFSDELSESDVPVLGMPVEATPSTRVTELLEEGYTTVFEFPLRDPEGLRGRIERKLRTLGENTVALLPRLNRIHIRCPEWRRTWRIHRDDFTEHDGASLVHLMRETYTEGEEEETESQSFVVFETEDVDRDAIAKRSNLSEVEIDTMGVLSVGIGFRADPIQTDPETDPAQWRLAPVYGSTDDQPPHVHVFLPTKELSPIPALITGTFQSDTSRRNLTLDYDDERGYDGQFNALLFDEVGELLAEKVVPFLDDSATTTTEFLATIDPSLSGTREWSFTSGSVEHCLFETITDHLASVPFVPTHGSDLPRPIEDLVLPHTAAEAQGLGEGFTELVDEEYVTTDDVGGFLPSVDHLSHCTTNALEALGATRLPPSSIPRSLDRASTDPPLREHVSPTTERSSSDEALDPDEDVNEPARLWVDPVLVHLVDVRKTLESDEDRDAFDSACRSARLFPIETTTRSDGVESAIRTTADSRPLFMPPEEPIESGSIPTLGFLARELYHGTDPDAAPELRKEVLPSDFRSELENIWQIDSFSFERVFDTSIRPSIPGPNSRDADTTPLESLETLATLRKMAAVGSPDNDRDPLDPLLYRSSRRSFFELSKLPVPARPLGGGDVEWQPAHRVYVGREWQTTLGRTKEAQIEPLLTAVDRQTTTDRFEPWFLPSLEWFGLDGSDTVEVEEWVSFFKWLGVAEHVRPLPLFAPDAATRHRYRKTKAFERPPRSAISSSADLVASDETETPTDPRYSGLSDEEWQAYREHLLENVDPKLDVEEHGYLFQINPLEYAEEILSAATADASIGERLLKHIATWWDDGLANRQYAIAAEFTNNRWRGSNRSYFFRTNERRRAGANLWIWQLRQHDWVPTSQGQVAPTEAWLVSAADRKRFSLQLDRDRSLLPFVEALEPIGGTSANENVTSALGIGTQLERGRFSPADAARVLSLTNDHLQNASIDLDRFAGEIELLYTRVAELLPGLEAEQIADPEWQPEQTGLDSVPILCWTDEGFSFRRASDAYFVRSHSERERYANLNLPHIVLFKPEAARFGMHLGATDTADVVTKTPHPGDDIGLPVEVDGTRIDEEWVQTVLVALLLRLRSDRPSAAAVDQDTNNTRRFFQQLDVVDGLDLELRTTESSARFSGDTRPQPYHIVRDGGTKKSVLVDGSLPAAEFVDALARAYTDYLDVPQYYEGVYNLLDHAFGEESPAGTLSNRLRIVGNGVRRSQFDVVRDRLFSSHGGTDIEYDDPNEDDESGASDVPDDSITVERDPTPTDAPESTGTGSASTSNRVPEIESLTRIGERRVYRPASNESETTEETGNEGPRRRSNGGSTSGGTPASQEYRTKIDEFGMALTIESERDRLRRRGESDPEEKVWDVSTPETYGDTLADSELVRPAIETFLESAGLSEADNPFDTDWPGFDVLTIATDRDGDPVVDRCIELKTSGLETRKPSLSWNEWKAAGSELTERYYLYVARNIRIGKSGDATLLEIPRPFQTLTQHRHERREREVQLDLRSFDLDDDQIVERPVEWDE